MKDKRNSYPKPKKVMPKKVSPKQCANVHPPKKDSPKKNKPKPIESKPVEPKAKPVEPKAKPVEPTAKPLESKPSAIATPAPRPKLLPNPRRRGAIPPNAFPQKVTQPKKSVDNDADHTELEVFGSRSFPKGAHSDTKDLKAGVYVELLTIVDEGSPVYKLPRIEKPFRNVIKIEKKLQKDNKKKNARKHNNKDGWQDDEDEDKENTN